MKMLSFQGASRVPFVPAKQGMTTLPLPLPGSFIFVCVSVCFGDRYAPVGKTFTHPKIRICVYARLRGDGQWL